MIYLFYYKSTRLLTIQDGQSEKTPLHYAIEKRNIDLVKKLFALANNLKYPINKLLMAKTGAGNSALHLAASIQMKTTDQRQLIQLLLSKGADPSTKNGEGLLPRELTKNIEVCTCVYSVAVVW